jgi:hypothetical protein
MTYTLKDSKAFSLYARQTHKHLSLSHIPPHTHTQHTPPTLSTSAQTIRGTEYRLFFPCMNMGKKLLQSDRKQMQVCLTSALKV